MNITHPPTIIDTFFGEILSTFLLKFLGSKADFHQGVGFFAVSALNHRDTDKKL